MKASQLQLQLILEQPPEHHQQVLTDLLHLFDLFWFERQVMCTAQPEVPINDSHPSTCTNGYPSSLEAEQTTTIHLEEKFPLLVKSLSKESLTSPKSVLAISELSAAAGNYKDQDDNEVEVEPNNNKQIIISGVKCSKRARKGRIKKRRQPRRRSLVPLPPVPPNRLLMLTARPISSSRPRRSLSEVEVEELKGFMDLGFVFSEQDKTSPRLVSILPGLQRLGVGVRDRKTSKSTAEQDHEDLKQNTDSVNDHRQLEAKGAAVSRPCMSEAWERLISFNEKKKKNIDLPILMMNERLPYLSDEADMKNHLRLWAHTVVASLCCVT